MAAAAAVPRIFQPRPTACPLPTLPLLLPSPCPFLFNCAISSVYAAGGAGTRALLASIADDLGRRGSIRSSGYFGLCNWPFFLSGQM